MPAEEDKIVAPHLKANPEGKAPEDKTNEEDDKDDATYKPDKDDRDNDTAST